jgi:cyclic pyranopterin phosphate synthase
LADEAKKLSHVSAAGAPAMVDVSAKAPTLRTASAEAVVGFPPEAWRALVAAGFATAKGPVFHTAEVAATMAAKRTHELIPFCHPLGLERCDLSIEPAAGECVVVRCTAAVHHRTGVEMEALTGASVAALTVYDMCKAVDKAMSIAEVRLLEKTKEPV